jgi:hypothetical protein
MNFSEESESEVSFRGKSRKDIETYIDSTLGILRSFHQPSSTQNSIDLSVNSSPLPHSYQRILSQDLQKPLPLHDIFVRYQEIKQQLAQQFHYISCRDRNLLKAGAGSGIDKRVQVTHYLSWPEHFHRHKNLVSHRLEPITPWEGSQYLITLLSSLADKLLLKYSFQFLQSWARYLRKSIRSAEDSYQKKCSELLQRIFVAWKEQWVLHLTNRVLTAKAYRCHVISLLKRGYQQWKSFVFIRLKDQKLLSLIAQRHRNRSLQCGLSSLKRTPERHWRRMRSINRAQRRRAVISSSRPHSSSNTQHLSASAHPLPERFVLVVRIRHRFHQWRRLLQRRDLKIALKRVGDEVTRRSQQRILVRSLCQWLRAMAMLRRQRRQAAAVAEEDKESAPAAQHIDHDQGAQALPSSAVSPPQRVDKATSVTLSLSRGDSRTPQTSTSSRSSLDQPSYPPSSHPSSPFSSPSFLSTRSLVSQGVQVEADHEVHQSTSLSLHSFTSRSSRVPASEFLSEKTNSLPAGHRILSPLVEAVAEAEAPLSQSISNLTEESQRSPLESIQTLLLPEFEANERTLPLSYAIYRMEQEQSDTGAQGTQQPIPKPPHRPAPVPPQPSQQHSHTQSCDLSHPLAKQRPQQQQQQQQHQQQQSVPSADTEREAQLHVIETRHRLRKAINSFSPSSPEESLSQRRPRCIPRSRGGSTRGSAEAEAERRFLRSQWIHLGELLHRWRQVSRSQRILRSVFSLCRCRWEDRLDRSRSDFLLLHTAFAAWSEFQQRNRDHRKLRKLTQRALVFRGMSLLTKGFTGWVSAVRVLCREREQERVRVLVALAQCWLSWMFLLKSSHEKYRVAVVSYEQRLLRRCWNHWSVRYLEETLFEQSTVTTVVGYLLLRRALERWRLTLRYSVVLRLHGQYERKREEKMMRECVRRWRRERRRCEEVRRGGRVLEKVLMRARVKRCFEQWPGRKLSMAATSLLNQVKRRREHGRREMVGQDKILRGLTLALGTTATAGPGEGEGEGEGTERTGEVPVGETPPPTHPASASASSAPVDPLAPLLGPLQSSADLSGHAPCGPSSAAAMVTGAVVNSMTSSSFPRFQWIHLPASSHRPPPPSSQSQSQQLHPSPFLIRPRLSAIPSIPPHPLSFQNRAVVLGLSDGLAPTRARIAAFLKLLLSLWRAHAHSRADIARRGLFLRACQRLRLLSKRFYEWVSRSSRLSYRLRIWRTTTAIGMGMGTADRGIQTQQQQQQQQWQALIPRISLFSSELCDPEDMTPGAATAVPTAPHPTPVPLSGP